MATCECAALPEYFKLDTRPGFEAHTTCRATGDWVRLHACQICGQRWLLDEWDKYQDQFVARIPPDSAWATFDATPLRKRFLIQSRGGLANTVCAWVDCDGRTVRKTAYCVDHLYETGALE